MVTHRIVTYLKEEPDPIRIVEPLTREEGETLLSQWQFTQSLWLEYGRHMDFLPLEE